MVRKIPKELGREEYSKLSQEERHEVDLIVKRGKKRSRELDKLIDPIYQRMLDMGYSPEELQFP